MHSKKKIKLINSKRGPLTPEKLKELSGLNLSDEQAKEVIWSLTQYARIIFDAIGQKEQSAQKESDQELI